jgi:hypothetical protein
VTARGLARFPARAGEECQSTKGWLLDAERNVKENTAVPYYDTHSIDKVRA